MDTQPQATKFFCTPISKVLSKTSSPTHKSLRERASSLKKSISHIFAPPISKTFVFFGILGIAGPLEQLNVGWMVTDFMVWASLLYHKPGFDRSRSRSWAIRNVLSLFETPTSNGKIRFGEAACDRLELPIPDHLEFLPKDNLLSAHVFVSRCLVSLRDTSRTMKPNETLVLLLIGHGSVSKTDEFLFCVTTKNNQKGEAWISKYELEAVLQGCKGSIVIICNSCCSGRLESPRWTLICTAGASQFSNSLSQSGLSMKSSGLASSAPSQDKREQGIELSHPCSEKHSPVESMARLPENAPYSFYSSSRLLSELTDCPLRVFIDRVKTLQVEKFLIMQHEVEFRQHGDSEVCPKKPGKGSICCNCVFHPPGLQVDSSSTPTLEELANKVLPLAKAYMDTPHFPHGRDHTLCHQFLRQVLHSDQRYPLTESNTDGLYYTLHSRNVQAMVVQGVAKRLGWWNEPRSKFLPFLVLEDGENVGEEMTSKGIDTFKLLVRILCHFDGLWGVADGASVRWLGKRWVDAGRPTLYKEEWIRVVDEEAEAAVGTVL